jgi:hypothetical protein
MNIGISCLSSISSETAFCSKFSNEGVVPSMVASWIERSRALFAFGITLFNSIARSNVNCLAISSSWGKFVIVRFNRILYLAMAWSIDSSLLLTKSLSSI